MSWFSKKTENQDPKDESQKHYREVFQVKDCIGKPMIELEYGIVNAKRVMP